MISPRVAQSIKEAAQQPTKSKPKTEKREFVKPAPEAPTDTSE